MFIHQIPLSVFSKSQSLRQAISPHPKINPLASKNDFVDFTHARAKQETPVLANPIRSLRHALPLFGAYGRPSVLLRTVLSGTRLRPRLPGTTWMRQPERYINLSTS
jgi:hypothetical protein